MHFLPLLPLTSAPTTQTCPHPQNSLFDASGMRRDTATEPTALKADQSFETTAVLTPPITPNKADMERKRSSISMDSAKLMAAPTEELKNMLLVGSGLGADPKQMVEHMIKSGMDVGPLSEVPETARPYQKSYQLGEVLGHGAWSTVQRACEVNNLPQVSGSMPPSPPSTPERPSTRGTHQKILAVKVLARRDGRRILEQEARVLTYLHSHATVQNHLVEFLGFDDARCSIIMAAVPLSLDKYVKTAGKAPVTEDTMHDPVIGAQEWKSLSQSLIQGLRFLRSKGCVHGDVKPANILLQVDDSHKKLTGLYCDFSSSHVISSTTSSDEIPEVNAVTTDYTSPELLRALKSNNANDGERAVVTFASDVFALGVTLLFAATGESPYSGAQIEIQKTAMALEGRPLEYARSSSQGSRVKKGKVVFENLEGAVDQDLGKRLQWANRLI